MPQPFGYRGNIDAVGDQQSSIGMAQGMDICIGQIIFPNELPDPGCQAVWMQRITIPLGEYEIIIVPAVTKLKPLHCLLFSVLFQFGENNVCQFDDNGLDYVPFDGYIARLHEGERVLTKEEARSGGKSVYIGNINLTEKLIVSEKTDIDEIARALVTKLIEAEENYVGGRVRNT